MAGERDLDAGREDPDSRMAARRGGVDEDRLGEAISFASGCKPLLGHRARIGEDSELVAGKRHVREHVGNDVPVSSASPRRQSREPLVDPAVVQPNLDGSRGRLDSLGDTPSFGQLKGEFRRWHDEPSSPQ